jgi:hypothetical protein
MATRVVWTIAPCARGGISLQGTTQSVVGAVAGTLVGALGNGATLPMVGIMAGFAALAAVFLFAARRMQLRDLPAPEPKPGWVLVQVKAFGLNRS